MMKTASATAIALMALAGLALASCDKNAAADTKLDKTKVATGIKNDVHDLVESLNAKDVDAAAAHDAANYVGMFHGAPNSVGIEQDKATTKQVVADPLFWVQLGNETVDVSDAGDMAVYRTSYQYRHTGEKSKKEVKELGNWVIGYKKQPNGAWKVAWNVISDTPPEAAAPEPAAKK
jgi:ketosteroid isomerase-like protein